MKLYALRIFTTRWQEAIDFYQNKLALPLKFQQDEWGWAEFDAGGASLAIERLTPDDPEAEQLVGRFLGLSLQVEDISDCYKKLKAKGVVFTSPPSKQPWGGQLAHFKDNSGNILSLVS